MTDHAENSNNADTETRDISDVPAVEIVTTIAVHLMTASAIKLGLGEPTEGHNPEDDKDLAEARILITSLAGLVKSAAPMLGNAHARPLRDGLKTLQEAFREASDIPDAPGEGPGEKV